MSIPISPNGIKSVLSLKENSPEDVDINLKILSIKEIPLGNSGKITFITELSDDQESYEPFILIKKYNLQVNDIIKIFKIKSVDNKINKRRFLVVDYLRISSVKEENEENKEFLDNSKEVSLSNKRITNLSNKLNAFTLISELNTFLKNFKMLVKVYNKSAIKVYVNHKGEGKVFRTILQDQEGFKIQAACFGKTVESLYDLLKAGMVIEIINPNVQNNYTKVLKENSASKDISEYELTLNDKTIINIVTNQDELFKEEEVKYDIFELGDLSREKLNTYIDTIGIVVEATPKEVIKGKNGDVELRKIFLSDLSCIKFELPLWRENADMKVNVDDVLLLKNVLITEFRGLNLNITELTSIVINPSINKTEELKKFKKRFQGKYQPYKEKDFTDKQRDFINKTSVVLMEDVINAITLTNQREGSSKTYTIKATVITLPHREGNFYVGCPLKKCKKKLIKEVNAPEGVYKCKNCGDIKNPALYLTISIKVKDLTSEHWLDFFGVDAEKFLNTTADEYKKLFDNNDSIGLELITNNIENKEFFFSVKAKQYIYEDVSRQRISSYRSELVNKKEEINRVLDRLNNII